MRPGPFAGGVLAGAGPPTWTHFIHWSGANEKKEFCLVNEGECVRVRACVRVVGAGCVGGCVYVYVGVPMALICMCFERVMK